MGAIGFPELIVVLVIGVLWLVPLAAAMWALFTLKQLRDGQRNVQTQLDAIAHLLQRPS